MFVSFSFDRLSAGSSPIEGQHSRNDRSRPNDNHTREAAKAECEGMAEKRRSGFGPENEVSDIRFTSLVRLDESHSALRNLGRLGSALANREGDMILPVWRRRHYARGGYP
jgi:hypothetical protein